MAPALSVLLAIIFCALVTLAVRVWLVPTRFADTDVYIEIAAELKYAPLADLFPLEPLSRGLIALLANTLTNPVDAVYVASWINSILFIVLFGAVAVRDSVTWRGLVLVWGLYGALLAFVTLRATPAYLLVTLAILALRERPWLACASVVVAAGFHISALMALPPMCVQLLLNRLPGERYNKIARPICIATIVLACLIYGSLGLWGHVVADLMASVLGIHEALAKFLVYAEAPEGAQSLFHRAYFFGLIALLVVCLLDNKAAVFRHLPYACISLTIMAVLSPSPVVAFRQSLYWAAPLILTMPWQTLTPGPMSPFLFVLAAVALFALGLGGTLIA